MFPKHAGDLVRFYRWHTKLSRSAFASEVGIPVEHLERTEATGDPETGLVLEALIDRMGITRETFNAANEGFGLSDCTSSLGNQPLVHKWPEFCKRLRGILESEAWTKEVLAELDQMDVVTSN